MSRKYLLQRLGLFFVVIWGAASLNFILPRLAPGDPVRARLFAMQATGGYQQSGVEEMVKAYQARFGLDKPLWQQYLNYLADTARFDFGYSLSFFPTKATDLIFEALPWTIGLLTVTTILAFSIGTLLGALIAWPKSPKFLELLMAPIMTLAAVPYYLLGLILVYTFAFTYKWFPISGGYTPGTMKELTWPFAWDVIEHSILPAISIILASIGAWALGIRAMMITTSGEDYMTFAEARGLKDWTIFGRYALRNAMLPQFTALALSLGHVVSGAIIVEVVFAYPGVGTLLYTAIQNADYFVIYGVVFMVILTIGIATLAVDLLYPLFDPRIRNT